MSYMEDDFFNNVIDLYRKNEWKNILNLNEKSNIQKATRILWVWPSEEDIRFIENIIVGNGLRGIISIGCGSGLLEWILQQSTELEIIGVEVNEEWWQSKYSCPTFIKLTFPTFPLDAEVLNPEYALLFCYFNDGSAFQEYVRNYKGSTVIIIGPSYGKGRHTDPQPFEAKFPTSDWEVRSFKEVKNTGDFIVYYTKLTTAYIEPPIVPLV
ncbi:hypothetical protein HHI36_003086 [Cryptolaemus montrouzieri]|uniref:Uncharacterized protein n=1 Tax=Cryptolaemus montrouzieri TaxID=559131 RepID=A0ABD2PD14_9CUCU